MKYTAININTNQTFEIESEEILVSTESVIYAPKLLAKDFLKPRYNFETQEFYESATEEEINSNL